jgi:hypothetical protein
MAVISMSAADYNNDGLLDVYLCTYRPAAPAGASPAGGVAQVKEGDFDWPDEFFSPELAREYRRRLADHKQRKGGTVLDQIGPPNVLLINRGGAFRTSAGEQHGGIGATPSATGAITTGTEARSVGRQRLGPSNLFRNDGRPGLRTTPSWSRLRLPWALPGATMTMMA